MKSISHHLLVLYHSSIFLSPGSRTEDPQAIIAPSFLLFFSLTLLAYNHYPNPPPPTPKTSKRKRQTSQMFRLPKNPMNTLHPTSRVSEQRFYHLSENNAIRERSGESLSQCSPFESFFLQNGGWGLSRRR